MDLEARTDDTHREILGFLPPDLMDFTDLEGATARLMSMLTSAPPELPSSVVIDDHHVAAADGHQILVRLYRPRQARAASPCLYWMHGGGLVLGNVAMDDARCAEIVERLHIVIASVEYRLAPAFPYPVPLDDCYAGLEWLFGAAGELGLDAARIAIGGDSAGAGFAAALALLARDRGQLRPCFQLLRYPMIDDRNTTPSSHEVTDLRVWNRSANLVGWEAYLGADAGTKGVTPYAAAARATDLAGLPPAFVTVGELDMFLDEDIDYARRLIAAGVSTELHVYGKCIHGSGALVPHAEASQRWKRDEIDALDRALNGV
ncbi:MAG: alpha/beta hydrolase [Ilumatobacteraceae bacterium]